MTPVRTRVGARQDAVALLIASTMNLVPIINIFHPYLALMLHALQWKAVTDTPFLTVLRSAFRNLGLEHDVGNLAPSPRLAGQ